MIVFQAEVTTIMESIWNIIGARYTHKTVFIYSDNQPACKALNWSRTVSEGSTYLLSVINFSCFEFVATVDLMKMRDSRPVCKSKVLI